MGTEKIPKTITWETDEATGRSVVYIVDQSRLPLQGDMLGCNTHEGICLAIGTMALRGAPALGIGAAMALALWSENESEETDVDSYLAALDEVAKTVVAVRPTAVNLAWGAAQVTTWAHDHSNLQLDEIKAGVVERACALRDDDAARCHAIGDAGVELFSGFDATPDANGEPTGGARVMTICNAGSLATAEYGTALGIIYSMQAANKLASVWACETRPVNQGARLTSWELSMAGVPNILICDSMAASIMARGWVDAVIVGADRIAKNGDVANKIGTYALACLAKMHDIPFYVAAPKSTIDLETPTGDDIKIESRDPREMEGVTASGVILPEDADTTKAFDLLTEKGDRALKMKNGHEMVISRKGGGYRFDAWMRTTPVGVYCFNPAFDVTPAGLITNIITEDGIIAPSDVASLSL